MAVEIVMPRVDMDMSSGQMGRWHAAEGAHVVKGATMSSVCGTAAFSRIGL
jgi:pyruvate/2-oxoglutarate dehydrogenase complex dihydrolipoamide acyltransferase (E2) component